MDPTPLSASLQPIDAMRLNGTFSRPNRAPRPVIDEMTLWVRLSIEGEVCLSMDADAADGR
jgi:hypothetical protein